jgi:hypothetical protein
LNEIIVNLHAFRRVRGQDGIEKTLSGGTTLNDLRLSGPPVDS